MNEGRLSELGHKFNASLRKDDALEMDRGFGSGEGKKAQGLGKWARAMRKPSRDGLAQPHLRQGLQSSSKEARQDVSIPGGVSGLRKAPARVWCCGTFCGRSGN